MTDNGTIYRLRTYQVEPNVPERLSPLLELAYNLWWCWKSDAIQLFWRIDRDLWEEVYHNPVRLLGMVSQARLNQLCKDESFLSHMDRVYGEFLQYMGKSLWFDQNHTIKLGGKLVYLSMEYGLHESVPNYSGGLGVLSGDHLKSASDLGLPLVAVGLAYQAGYFRQYLNSEGWQQETYPQNDFHNMALKPVRTEDGLGVEISVDLPGRPVYARIWKINVGRVPLYLLDTNVEKNSPADREITAHLYGGDIETRIKQEIVLGIGGMRAMQAVGVKTVVCHMNEGHSAFLALERIRTMMQERGIGFDQAKELVALTNAFTTHTPVPAGIDKFPEDLMARYFAEYHKTLGISWRGFMAMGRHNPSDNGEPFSMAVLALHLAAKSNGVSRLHGEVSRSMWNGLWPRVPINDIPIAAITNGIHTASWTSTEMQGIFDRYLGPAWRESSNDQGGLWERVESIPDAELWRTHERRRERLVSFARNRLRQQLIRRGAPKKEISYADEVLDPEALTIGFARRFATYKRAALLLSDPERLMAILTNKQRPVQIIFAGKAHPHDGAGKELIKKLVNFAAGEDIRRSVVFLEDYDINVARYLVQGCDVWLNTPLRPLEASGTSGMKVVPNGGLNLSVLDGWWAEGYSSDVGWSIGKGESYENRDYQDEVESRAVYQLLEKELAPLFYDLSHDGLPRGWIAKMKASMSRLCPVYNTHRMVQEYTNQFYMPLRDIFHDLTTNEGEVESFVAWLKNVEANWGGVAVDSVVAENSRNLKVGDSFRITASLRLGGLSPKDVAVHVYWGPTDAGGDLVVNETREMVHNGRRDGDRFLFEGRIPCLTTGQHGFAVRVLPRHKNLADRFMPGLVTWG